MLLYIAACIIALYSLEKNMIIGKILPNLVLVAKLYPANMWLVRAIGIAAFGDILMEAENYNATMLVFTIVHFLFMQGNEFEYYCGPYKNYITAARLFAILLIAASYVFYANKKFNNSVLVAYVLVNIIIFDLALAAANLRLIFAAAAFMLSDLCIAMMIDKKINNYVVLPLYWLSLYSYAIL